MQLPYKYHDTITSFLSNNADVDTLTTQRLLTVNIIGYLLIAIVMTFSLLNIFIIGDIAQGSREAFAAALALLFLLLQRSIKNYRIIFNAAVALLVITIAILIMPYGLGTSDFLWFYLVPPLAFFITGIIHGTLWTIVTFIIIAIYIVMHHIGTYPESLRYTFVLDLSLSYTVISIFSFSYEWARRNALEELARTNDELHRLVYTVSHDLKTPIVSMLGYLSFIEEEIQSGDIAQRDKDLKKLTHITENMRQMIDDLLNFSRITQEGELNTVPTANIFLELLDEVESQLREGNIETMMEGSFPTIKTDKRKFEEIFRNLISNAIKYIGHQSHPCIRISVQNDSHYHIFSVTDNGIGIESNEIQYIFDPFYRKSDARVGSGIGLSIVKGFVSDLGGTVAVESVIKQGSTFRISLPKT